MEGRVCVKCGLVSYSAWEGTPCGCGSTDFRPLQRGEKIVTLNLSVPAAAADGIVAMLQTLLGHFARARTSG